MNPAQIRPGVNVRTTLEQGTIDAAGSYRTGIRLGTLPYVALPADVNLSDPQLRRKHPDLTLRLADQVFYPDPLMLYVTTLVGSG